MEKEQRLIDANALKFEPDSWGVMNGVLFLGRSSGKLIGLVQLALTKMIRNAPTVEAVEVVHGYWHIDDYDGGEPDGYAAFIEVHCSNCGYELGAESGQYGWAYGDPFPLNYCPNCGAKMDGGDEGG